VIAVLAGMPRTSSIGTASRTTCDLTKGVFPLAAAVAEGRTGSGNALVRTGADAPLPVGVVDTALPSPNKTAWVATWEESHPHPGVRTNRGLSLGIAPVRAESSRSPLGGHTSSRLPRPAPAYQTASAVPGESDSCESSHVSQARYGGRTTYERQDQV
jgi:hypothetical protein